MESIGLHCKRVDNNYRENIPYSWIHRITLNVFKISWPRRTIFLRSPLGWTMQIIFCLTDRLPLRKTYCHCVYSWPLRRSSSLQWTTLLPVPLIMWGIFSLSQINFWCLPWTPLERRGDRWISRTWVDNIFTIPLSIMGNSLTTKCQLRVQYSPGIYSSSRPAF